LPRRGAPILPPHQRPHRPIPTRPPLHRRRHPFDEYGFSTVAEVYNVSAAKAGKVESVYFSKQADNCAIGTCALDRERGVLDGISASPWQTDTCIGDWHYKRGVAYKTPKKVIDLLVDIVSKNGNLLLNFPLPNNGELDWEEAKTLEGITRWMAVNSEGIYATRPWMIYGEGPSTKVVIPKNGKEFDPNEGKKPDLTADDIRFTTKARPSTPSFKAGPKATQSSRRWHQRPESQRSPVPAQPKSKSKFTQNSSPQRHSSPKPHHRRHHRPKLPLHEQTSVGLLASLHHPHHSISPHSHRHGNRQSRDILSPIKRHSGQHCCPSQTA
jgi:alpha-L-fucosidase